MVKRKMNYSISENWEVSTDFKSIGDGHGYITSTSRSENLDTSTKHRYPKWVLLNNLLF